MTTKKILILGISLLQLINSSRCWPNFFYYGRQSNQVYNLSSTDSLKNTEFNYSWPTILIVHGFGSHAFEPFLIQMKDKFHKHVEINTIMVDWKQGATASNNFVLKALYYIIAITNLRTLGQGTSVFIQTNRIDPDTITCVGHSLGAHGCGFIAKAYYAHTRRRLSRISGLDPAGPLFQLFQIAFPARYRLDSDDAAFVDCIFTSTYSGIILPICKANFYPNALNGQPQCETNDDNCEHGAAVYFYIESIAASPTCTFSAAQCVNYQLTCSLCTGVFPNNNEKMGFYTPNYTRGIFLLNTKPTPPYCLN